MLYHHIRQVHSLFQCHFSKQCDLMFPLSILCIYFFTLRSSSSYLCFLARPPIYPIYPYPTSYRSILILSTHQPLGLPSGLLPSGFPTKTLYNPLSSQIHPNIIHPSTSRSPQWSPSLRFPHQDPIHKYLLHVAESFLSS